ncbi:unnamed protein product [Gadus morhua 'NCC']
MKLAIAFLMLYFAGSTQSRAPTSCEAGRFLFKHQCVLCHPTCSECEGHELFECTTCGVDEDGHERYLHQRRCRLHCPRGTYSDRGRRVCLPCMANCELCSDANVCAKCREHYSLLNGVCQKASCELGQSEDPDTGECVDCAVGCRECSTDDPEICSTCAESHFLFRQQCRRHCPQSTYEDPERRLCQLCSAPCTECRSDTHCLACQTGHFMNDGECVKQCPRQSFPDADGWRCQTCHSSCQSCHGPRSTHCDSCVGGKPSVHGQCPLVSCPEGQYGLSFGVPSTTRYYREGSSCEECDRSCEQCTGPGPGFCQACAAPLLELLGTRLCQTCTGDASPKSCLTCDLGNTLLDNVCYPRTFVSHATARADTAGAGPAHCLSCLPHFGLHAMEGRCAPCCQTRGNDTNCCVCYTITALCTEAPLPKSGDLGGKANLNTEPARSEGHALTGLPLALLLALGLALAVFALVRARAKKRLCWHRSYERLSGSARGTMPHGVPEPDGGGEADVVYTTKGGSVYRRYSFYHDQDPDVAQHDADDNLDSLNRS